MIWLIIWTKRFKSQLCNREPRFCVWLRRNYAPTTTSDKTTRMKVLIHSFDLLSASRSCLFVSNRQAYCKRPFSMWLVSGGGGESQAAHDLTNRIDTSTLHNWICTVVCLHAIINTTNPFHCLFWIHNYSFWKLFLHN